MRPYDLPSTIIDPPAPPVGTRWKYNGIAHRSNIEAHRAFIGKREWIVNYCQTYDSPCHYLEAVPLRAVPEGFTPVLEGFEYCGIGQLATMAEALCNDVIGFGVGGWSIGYSGDSPSTHYALRIGSEIHHRNFGGLDAEPTCDKDSNVGNETDCVTKAIIPPTPALATKMAMLAALPPSGMTAEQARAQVVEHLVESEKQITLQEPQEWDVWKDGYGSISGSDASEDTLIARGRIPIRVREIPLPPPPFDWAALWQELPSWIKFVAMDGDGDWYSYVAEPQRSKSGVWHGVGAIRIPDEFAPPRAADWKLTLAERPMLTMEVTK